MTWQENSIWTAIRASLRVAFQVVMYSSPSSYASVKTDIFGSENCLSPVSRLTNIQTNDGSLLIDPRGINLSDICPEMIQFLAKK